MIKSILKLLFIVCMYSCQKFSVSPVITIKVPEIANDVWMTMSEIVDTAIYIPLETTDECLIDASMFAYSGGYPFSISGDIRSLPS